MGPVKGALAASNNKIKVLHLRSSAGAGGGPEKTILNTGSLIDKNTFYYHIAYLRHKEDNLEPIRRQAEQLHLHFTELPGGRILDLSQLADIKKLIATIDADIIHCHDYKTDVYGVLLKMAGGRFRLVTTLHGWILGRGFKKLYVWLDKAILPFFDVVIAVSSPIAEIVRKKGAKHVELIHNAIDETAWRPEAACLDFVQELPDAIKSVAFVGRISKEKGPLDFVKIAAKVLESIPECRFAVAGDGPLLKEMQIMVSDMDMKANFIFLGQLPPERTKNLYRRVTLVLSPSHTEGLPNTLLEACAMQKPVVATDVGGVASLIENGDNGFLFSQGDIEGMAKAVIRILKNDDLAIKLGLRGRQKICEAFSFEKRVQRIQKIYTALIRHGFKTT
jgi:glycosyltransferase involved in cell wall biosynthesis